MVFRFSSLRRVAEVALVVAILSALIYVVGFPSSGNATTAAAAEALAGKAAVQPSAGRFEVAQTYYPPTTTTTFIAPTSSSNPALFALLTLLAIPLLAALGVGVWCCMKAQPAATAAVAAPAAYTYYTQPAPAPVAYTYYETAAAPTYSYSYAAAPAVAAPTYSAYGATAVPQSAYSYGASGPATAGSVIVPVPVSGGVGSGAGYGSPGLSYGTPGLMTGTSTPVSTGFLSAAV